MGVVVLGVGLGERAHFLGNVPYEKIPLLIRASNVFVLNSEYEGLSHTLLEVMNLGTPIVASNVCGNPEVIQDGVNGLLVDPRDSTTLRDAVRKLLADPALARRMTEAGLARRPEFTRERTFSEVESQLQRVAGRVRRPR